MHKSAGDFSAPPGSDSCLFTYMYCFFVTFTIFFGSTTQYTMRLGAQASRSLGFAESRAVPQGCIPQRCSVAALQRCSAESPLRISAAKPTSSKMDGRKEDEVVL